MKSKKKTTKKAVTLLTRIEALLSDVIDQCSAIEKSVEKNVRVLLRSAEASVMVAKEFFSAPEPAKGQHKAAKAAKRVARKPAAASHKRPAAHAKKAASKAAKPKAKRAPQTAAPIASAPVPQAWTAAS